MVTEYQVGGTELRIEGDLIFIRTRGALVPEAATQIIATYQRLTEEQGRYFMLADMDEVGTVPPALRRQLVVGTRAYPPLAAAFYGGSLATRAMNALLISALNLLSGQRHNLATFQCEEQARHWLATERKRLTEAAEAAPEAAPEAAAKAATAK